MRRLLFVITLAMVFQAIANELVLRGWLISGP